MEKIEKIEKKEVLPTSINPLDLEAYFNEFKRFVSTQLIEGINDDYGLIPGTKKKTLFKSGAEKLANFFGIYAEPELIAEKIDWEKPFFYFAYRYTAYSIKTGRKLAIGEGSANSKETKFRRNNPYDIENVIRKIAMKRAFVSTIIAATRGSFMFTQDMEDFIQSTEQNTEKEKENKVIEIQIQPQETYKEEPQETPKEETKSKGISNKQWKFLYAKLHQAGFNLKTQVDKQLIENVFKKMFGISIKEITTKTLNEFIEFLDNNNSREDLIKYLKEDTQDLENPLIEELL